MSEAELCLLLSNFPEDNRPELFYKVLSTTEGKLRLVTPQKKTFDADSVAESFYYLESDLYDNYFCFDEQQLIVHASAVRHIASGLILLFIGPSHCGKSTLALAHIATGNFEYLGEEAIGLESQRLIPYPKPLKLRFDQEKSYLLTKEWTSIRVKNLNFTYVIPPNNRVCQDPPQDFQIHFLFPTFDPQTDAKFLPISRAQIFAQLSTYAVNPPPFIQRNFHLLAESFSQIPSKQLRWNDPKKVVQLVESYCRTG